jgi:hypothetical protein
MFDYTTVTAGVLKSFMESKARKDYKVISPSSLGNCMRYHFYKLKGIDDTTPPNYGALINFQIGHIWEEFVAGAYEHEGVLIKWFKDGKDKPWVNKELGYGGTPDIIAKDDKSEAFIVDCKTVRSEWFRYLKRDLAKPDGFKKWVKDNKTYIFQQVCYILLARENGYPEMRYAVLSFASKDDGYVGLELKITLTTELANMVLDRIKLLRGYLDRDELPPCECEGWKVGYCGMGDPNTRTLNTKKKEVNTTCCSEGIWENYLREKER